MKASSGVKHGGRLRLNIAPQPKIIRAREPVTPSKGRVVGYYPSVKNNRQIAWESQLEKKACNLFEYSSVVKRYREQPRTVYVPNQGEVRRYTPDFELTLTSGELVYVEIKPVKKLNNQKLKERLQDISRWFEEYGYHFIVITDEELNQPIRQRNLSMLRQSLRYLCTPDLVQRAREWMEGITEATLEELFSYLDSRIQTYALIAQGHLAINLDEQINLNSQVFIPEETKDETCLFTYRIAPDFGRNTLSY